MPSVLKTCVLIGLLLSACAHAATSTVTITGAVTMTAPASPAFTSPAPLRATLQTPDRVTSPPVVLVLGSGLGASSARLLTDALQRAGYATLRPLPAAASFGDQVQAARAWLGWVSAQRVYGPLVVLGHGEGALVGLAALQPPLPGPAVWQRAGLAPDLEVSALVSLDGPLSASAALTPDPLTLAPALKLPMLLVQGGRDPQAQGAQLFVAQLPATGQRPTVLLLPGMNRQLTDAAAGADGPGPLDPVLLRGIMTFLHRLDSY